MTTFETVVLFAKKCVARGCKDNQESAESGGMKPVSCFIWWFGHCDVAAAVCSGLVGKSSTASQALTVHIN